MTVSPTSVTVVVTTKDRAELAREALLSVANQSHPPQQVIVVDDGSAQPFVPPDLGIPVEVIRNDFPLGPSAARNQALAKTSGHWVTFLDDDDTLDPEMIERSVAAAADSELPEPVSVLSGAAIVTPAGEVLKVRLPPSLVRGQHYFLEDLENKGSFQTHATLVAPTEVVREIGGFDESLRGSEHDDFFLRLNAVSSIQGIPDVLYSIRAHDGPRLSKALLERAEGMGRTVSKHRATFSEHPRRFSAYLATMGMTYLRAGIWGKAVVAMARAVWVDPLRSRNYLWLLAALAGPYALRVFRWGKRRLGS